MMELGEFLFMIVQQMTDMAQKELEARGVPVSLRPLVMECICNRITTAAYDHIVAVRAKEAQEAVKPAEEQPKTVTHTATKEEALKEIQKSLGQNSLTQVQKEES